VGAILLFHETSLRGAYVVELERRGDERGFFARMFCRNEFRNAGLASVFVQVNNSLSVDRATLRGLHYQLPPHAETKVVRCIRGSLWDCIVDLRPNSPTFGNWFGETLSAENRKMMYVPKNFAHGFITLEPNTEALYLVDEFYASEHERGMRWDDPKFGIRWPMQPQVISEKDAKARDFDSSWHLSASNEAAS
jgi:dTDP-4-dehydrorhamnose 3,5-epimerase